MSQMRKTKLTLEEATSNLMARTLWPSFADAPTIGFKAADFSAVRESAITNVLGWPAYHVGSVTQSNSKKP